MNITFEDLGALMKHSQKDVVVLNPETLCKTIQSIIDPEEFINKLHEIKNMKEKELAEIAG